MPTANLVLDRSVNDTFLIENGVIPEKIQTDSGIMLIEIQGTIHVGKTPLITSDLDLSTDIDDDDYAQPQRDKERLIGHFDFSRIDKQEVSLVIGRHQRLRGKIASLTPPMALLRLKEDESTASNQEDITVLEIIKHKIVFDNRPEPVTD